MRRYVVTQSRFTRESRTRTSSPDETSTSSSISSGTRTRGSWGFQRSRKIPPSTICGVQTNWSSWHKREPPTPDLDRQTHMKGQTDETRAIAVVQGQNAAKISTLCEYRPPPPPSGCRKDLCATTSLSLVQSHCRIVFADVHTATSSVRGAALASTCTGSTPQAHAARTCHAKEGGVGVLRHCYGVEAACCVVVAAHASADGRDATSVLRARVPRVGEDEEAPCDGAPRRFGGRRCASSSPPAARCGAGTGASRGRRTACRRGRSRGMPDGRRGGACGAGVGVRGP